MDIPTLSLVEARRDAEWSARVHSRIVPVDGHAVNVVVELARADLGLARPRVTAIGALVNAIHFGACPDSAMITGIDSDLGRPGRPHRGTLVNADIHLLPRLPAVARPESLGPGTDVDVVRVHGVHVDRPDLHPLHGRFEETPGLAVVVAAVDAHPVRPRQDSVRVVRIDCERTNISLQSADAGIRKRLIRRGAFPGVPTVPAAP